MQLHSQTSAHRSWQEQLSVCTPHQAVRATRWSQHAAVAHVAKEAHMDMLYPLPAPSGRR